MTRQPFGMYGRKVPLQKALNSFYFSFERPGVWQDLFGLEIVKKFKLFCKKSSYIFVPETYKDLPLEIKELQEIGVSYPFSCFFSFFTHFSIPFFDCWTKFVIVFINYTIFMGRFSPLFTQGLQKIGIFLDKMTNLFLFCKRRKISDLLQHNTPTF